MDMEIEKLIETLSIKDIKMIFDDIQRMHNGDFLGECKFRNLYLKYCKLQDLEPYTELKIYSFENIILLALVNRLLKGVKR